MSALSYLRYEEILRMPVPLLNALVKVRAENASKGGGDISSIGPIINAFLGRR